MRKLGHRIAEQMRSLSATRGLFRGSILRSTGWNKFRSEQMRSVMRSS